MSVLSPSMGTLLRAAPFWVPRGNGVPADLFADFVNDNYWYAGARQASFQDFVNAVRGTFSRASSPAAGYYYNASGILVKAGTDIPRFTYNPVNGAFMGLLTEPVVTNLALWSRDMTQSGTWVASNITTAQTATGADGAANSATVLTATGANATILQTPGLAAANRNYSVSIRRVSGSGTIKLTLDGSTFNADISASLGTSKYYRAATLIQNVVPVIGIQIGTSGDVIEVDFNQLETGGVPTSPIVTTTVTDTRAEDQFNWPIPFSGWNTSAGALASNVSFMLITAAANLRSFNFSDGTLNNRIDTITGLVVVAGGATQASFVPAGRVTTSYTLNKFSAAWAANDFAGFINNGGLSTDPSGSIPSGLTIARLGAQAAGTATIPGVYSSVAYWGQRINNDDLQRLTM